MANDPHLDPNYINAMILTARPLAAHFHQNPPTMTPEECLATANMVLRYGALVAVLAIHAGIITQLPMEPTNAEPVQGAGSVGDGHTGRDQEGVSEEG